MMSRRNMRSCGARPGRSGSQSRGARWTASVLAMVRPLGLLGLPLVWGCQGDRLNPPVYIAEDQLYWALDLDHHAVTLSLTPPYDTLTLVATPRTAQGAALPELPVPQYLTRNPDQVQVTPDGVLHARQVTGQPVAVLATLTVGNLTHVDTVLVQVVDNPSPPVLASLSIHPVPPDSAKLGSTDFQLPTHLAIRALDTAGALIPGPLVSLRSSNPDLAYYDQYLQQFRPYPQRTRPGEMTIYASATLFGITKADTLPFRIGWPVMATVFLDHATLASGKDTLVFLPPELKVGVGAMVSFFANKSFSGLTGDAVFADSMLPYVAAGNTFAPLVAGTDIQMVFLAGSVCTDADCTAAGNIPEIIRTPNATASAVRVFTRPGTYDYYSARLGMRGRITVVAE